MADSPLAGDGAVDAAQAVAGAPSVLRNRDFLLLWLSQVFSQVGQNALLLGLLVLVQNLTQSPTQLSLATFALIAPSVLFSMLAGVLVDHLNKKTVLVTANVLRGALSLCYLLLDRSVFLIYIVSFLFSTVGQFFGPAEASAIPMLVGKRQLITANALFNLTLSGAQLVGLVIFAPLMIKLAGITGFMIALAVLFALAALCVSFLPRDRQAPLPLSSRDSAMLVHSVWAELVEGFHILRLDRLASLAMLFLTLTASVIPLLAVLGPVFAVSVIRASAEDVVYLFAPAGVGMLLATIFVNRVVVRVGKLRLMPGSVVIMGITLGLLAAAKTGGSFFLYNLLGRVLDTRHAVFELVPLVMILSFVLGITFVFVSIPAQTLLQERCPANFRGRIFGVQFTLSGAVSILPLLFAGSMADLLGVNKTIFMIGFFLVLVGLGTRRLVRTLPPEDRAVDPAPD